MAESRAETSSPSPSPQSSKSYYDSASALIQIDVLSVSRKVQYTIPSFPVITVALRLVIVSLLDGTPKHYHVFMHEDKELDNRLPVSIEIEETCTIKPSEFSQSADISGLILPEEGVVVIWKWLWVDKPNSEDEDDTQPSPSQSDFEDSSDAAEADQRSLSDTVVFKCIGTTKSKTYQAVLKKARDFIVSGHAAPVRLCPEPMNPWNSKAIAFTCYVNDKWERIGYIVDEILGDVHYAINQKAIKSVEFCWIRYITQWSKSGPGFFAGISITRSGNWPPSVIKASSTK